MRKSSPCYVFLWEQPSSGVAPRPKALDSSASALRGSALHIYSLEGLAWKSTHMYSEAEPFPSHLYKRKCDRKGGGRWWVTAQAGCLQMGFHTGRWLLWHPKKRLLVFLVATHFHPSSFQNNNAGKLDVILFRIYPFSSLEAWYIPPPPSPSPRLLHLLPAFMVMKVVTSLLTHGQWQGLWWNYNPESSSHPSPPPSLFWQRCAVLEGSLFIGLLCPLKFWNDFVDLTFQPFPPPPS